MIITAIEIGYFNLIFKTIFGEKFSKYWPILFVLVILHYCSIERMLMTSAKNGAS